MAIISDHSLMIQEQLELLFEVSSMTSTLDYFREVYEAGQFTLDAEGLDLAECVLEDVEYCQQGIEQHHLEVAGVVCSEAVAYLIRLYKEHMKFLAYTKAKERVASGTGTPFSIVRIS